MITSLRAVGTRVWEEGRDGEAWSGLSRRRNGDLPTDGHRPNLVHMDRAASESGADQKRVKLPESVFTGIGWYARFPYHYSGDGTLATQELGQADLGSWIATVVRAIRAIKADDESLKLQKEFYEKSAHPVDTAH